MVKVLASTGMDVNIKTVRKTTGNPPMVVDTGEYPVLKACDVIEPAIMHCFYRNALIFEIMMTLTLVPFVSYTVAFTGLWFDISACK